MKQIYTALLATLAAALFLAHPVAAKELNREEVAWEVKAAEALVAKSDKELFTWKSTGGILKKAQEALKKGDLTSALHNAGLASREAQSALKQKKRNTGNWKMYVPK